MKKYRIVNKFRFYFSMSIIVLTLITIVALAFNYTLSKGNEAKVEYISHTVRKSETVWDIAREAEHKGDIRDFIDEIISINNLEDSQIYPGQIIAIPK